MQGGRDAGGNDANKGVGEDRAAVTYQVARTGQPQCCFRPYACTVSLLFTMPYTAGSFALQIRKLRTGETVTCSWSHGFLVTEAGFNQVCLTPTPGLF